ncbi:Os02g0742051, partial [Oryza sativa Japonica Group]
MKQRTGVPHEFGRIDPQLRQDSVGKLGDSAAAHTGELGDGSGGDPPRGGERIRRFGMGGERERERGGERRRGWEERERER